MGKNLVIDGSYQPKTAIFGWGGRWVKVKIQKEFFLRIPSLPDFANFFGDSGHKYAKNGTNASTGQFSLSFPLF